MKNECKQLHSLILTIHENTPEFADRKVDFQDGLLSVSSKKGLVRKQQDKSDILSNRISKTDPSEQLLAYDEPSSITGKEFADSNSESNFRKVNIKSSIEEHLTIGSTSAVLNKGTAKSKLVIPGLNLDNSSSSDDDSFHMLHERGISQDLLEDPLVASSVTVKADETVPAATRSHAHVLQQHTDSSVVQKVTFALPNTKPTLATESAKPHSLNSSTPRESPTFSASADHKNVPPDKDLQSDKQTQALSEKGDASSKLSIDKRLEKVSPTFYAFTL